MSKLIAVTGKGGTGKTTVAALMIRALLDNKKGSVLAVDADPNSTLAEVLGIAAEDTISSICEETLKKNEALPAGMTKERFLEYKIQETLVEKDYLSLLTMGRPEGPGCYCFVNSLLRGILKDLALDYDFTVTDNEAGMEHLSRKTMSQIDIMFVVSDFSVIGVRSALKIYKLASSLEIKLNKSFLIINKVKGKTDILEKEIKDSPLTLAGTLPYTLELEKMSLGSQSIFNLPKEAVIVEKINHIVQNIVERT